MKLYEFRVDEGLTENYHSGGLCVVIADDEAMARLLLPETAKGVTVTEHVIARRLCIVGKDAGCC